MSGFGAATVADADAGFALGVAVPPPQAATSKALARPTAARLLIRAPPQTGVTAGRREWRIRLERPPALQRSADRHLVRILEISAHRKTARETRHANSVSRQQLRDVHRRCLALEIRIRRHDELIDPATADARHELRDLEVIRTDAVHRRDGAVEHVIATLVLTGALDREHIQGLLD